MGPKESFKHTPEQNEAMDLSQKVAEAKEFGMAMAEGYFSPEEADKICVDVLGPGFANPENYESGKFDYAEDISSDALTQLSTQITQQIHGGGISDWQLDQTDVRWYRDAGQGEHSDQLSLKEMLVVLNLYGEAEVSFYDQDDKLIKTVTMKQGDVMLVRETDEHHQGSLTHRVGAPKGNGVRIIGLLAHLEGGEI